MGLNYRPVKLLQQAHCDTRSGHVESRTLVVLHVLEGKHRDDDDDDDDDDDSHSGYARRPYEPSLITA